MKTIGLIGGMSWESTQEYYRFLNEGVKEALGGLNSAKILLYSFNFHEIEELQHREEWDTLTHEMIEAGKKLQQGGADLIAICTNTMHRMAPEIEEAIDIPLIHIADAAGREIERMGLKRVALLGTNFTMTEDFYRGRLLEKFGIEVVVPEEAERKVVHNIIYDELCRGIIREESRRTYVEIIEGLKDRGAEGVILGCTEIPLLIGDEDISIPVFDTIKIHSAALVAEAIKSSE